MAKALELTTTLYPRGPAAAIVLTDEQVAAIGGGAKAFPVTVTIDGRAHALRLARMGGENLIGFSKAAREQAGVAVGDTVVALIATDTGDRMVAVPDDLASALTAAKATETFEKLAYSHRKEYVRWVTDAKKAGTRADRIAKAVEMVKAGTTR
jgi:Bacteriocin-protection, YdeI or OmpD-Associated/Domain of unknown function (DUF1905)